MTRHSAIQWLLLASVALLVAAARWSARRTHNASDFLIAHRRLGPWLAACGVLGGTTNATVLILVVAAAFVWGVCAVWLAGGVLAGVLLSVVYVAPRLHAMATAHEGVTLTQLISSGAGERMQPTIALSAALIAFVALLLQASLAAGFAAQMLREAAGYSLWSIVLFGVAGVAACVFAGGLRAASCCDAVQSGAMALTLVLLPIPALIALGGTDVLMAELTAPDAAFSDWFAGKRGVVALALALGGFGIGCAAPGQPHAMARLMSVRADRSALPRYLTPILASVLLGAALFCGWCTRALYGGLQAPEQALYALATRLLPPALAGAFIVALFIALMSSVASPLLALASQCSVELRRPTALLSSGWTRLALVVAAAVAIAFTLLVPIELATHGWFPYLALGASFGPLLMVRLTGKRVRPGSVLGAMWTGFVLTVIFHVLPDSPGDFLERVLPFVASLGIALTGGERRRNPDRADRSQETMHHSVPI